MLENVRISFWLTNILLIEVGYSDIKSNKNAIKHVSAVWIDDYYYFCCRSAQFWFSDLPLIIALTTLKKMAVKGLASWLKYAS